MVSSATIAERVSLYEVLRARHASMQQLGAFGLDRDDLGAPLAAAARKAGMSPDRLAAAISPAGRETAEAAAR
jgi:hypothetical protein